MQSENQGDHDHEEPLAIIGMSCRFPNEANTLEKYWKLLLEQGSTVCPIPEWRWQAYYSSAPKVAAALNSATRLASYLSNIENFDADFFGITAREAEYIDPQQRFILELSWEALEHAGILPSYLRGKDVGVYIAANSFDFGHRLMANLADIQPWTVNGSMLFAIANRVSYVLDLRGPSMVVDTACAGSLTALHLACQALRDKDIPLAIVGGVNIISNPGMTIALDASGATASDGRSKAFDHSANGYGRGEGAGIIILKRFSEAIKSGDHILALIRGSGVFQDGKSDGMMAPNPEAQETMLRTLYKRYGIDPLSISYVEAHGTGTQAGDKAEVTALGKVIGAGRKPDHPCLIGSAKPNVGHLEAGAGMAGLIKTILSMQYEIIPPSIHNALNTEIDWQNSGLKVQDRSTPWPSSAIPKRAGVSCFGVGGTISHVILEEAPAVALKEKPALHTSQPYIFPLSARSNGALHEMAVRLADWMDANPHIELDPIGNTLCHYRDHHPKRAAVVASTRCEIIAGLHKLAAKTPDPQTVTGQYSQGVEKGCVWVFSGHGAQWPGMAQELLKKEPVFAQVVDELGPILKEELGYTAQEAILESNWSSIERIQVMTFVIQIALAALWRSKGLKPTAVIGHSVGELAAAVVAGALSQDSATRFACKRASLYQRIAGKGGMALVRLSFEETEAKLGNQTKVVAAIAASPKATIISGDIKELDSLLESWKNENFASKRNARIDAAFHSPHIDPLLPEIRNAAEQLITQEPTVPLYTTTLVDPRAYIKRDKAFWELNSRGIVRLRQAIEAALEDGFNSFLEISANPIVASSIRETIDFNQNQDATIYTTLQYNQPEMVSMAISLASMYCNGVNVDWSFHYSSKEFVNIPTMAWQHRSFWPSISMPSSNQVTGHAPDSHTLLGQQEHIRSAAPITIWRTQLDFDSRPYPGTHPIFGVEIVPAAALLYTLMKAGGKNNLLASLTNIDLRTPIPVDHLLDLQVVLQDHLLQISSKLSQENSEEEKSWAWMTHTTALRVFNEQDHLAQSYDLEVIRKLCHDLWSWERVETLYRKRGIGNYGFLWKMVELKRSTTDIMASFITQQTDIKASFTWAEILDAGLTICPLLLPDDEILRMPSHIDQVSIYGELTKEYSVHVSLQKEENSSSEERTLDVHFFNLQQEEIATIKGVRFGVFDNKANQQSSSTDIVFVPTWRPYDLSDSNELLPRSVIFVGPQLEWLENIAKALSEAGVSCAYTEQLTTLPEEGATVIVVGCPKISQSVEQSSEENAWRLIETAQTLVARNGNRLFCLTQGVRACTSAASLAQSTLWGVSRIIAGERPDLWCGLFDLDSETPSEYQISQLLKSIASQTQEDVIAIGQEQVEVLRLAPAQQSSLKISSQKTVCRLDATYLVTGGLGALGIEAAHYLISKGARR